MKGKSTFTKTESDVIEKLINDKLNSNSDKQKSIRNKIRKIGFYYSDFSASKHGYTVKDYKDLINTGQVVII